MKKRVEEFRSGNLLTLFQCSYPFSKLFTFPAAALSLYWTSSMTHGPAEYPVYSACLYYYTKGL